MALNQTVTVKRYTTDKYGDRVLTATFQVGQCGFAPRSMAETDDRSTTVIADADLFGPPWMGITAKDVVVLADGSAWEAQGDVEKWAMPFGSPWFPGCVVHLKRTKG